MDTEPLVRDETVMLDGLRFHYRDWGDPAAPPLVLLHGFTGNARQWDSFARAMADRYRVLALDQRGHGETDWAPDQDYSAARVHEDFVAFVAALGLERLRRGRVLVRLVRSRTATPRRIPPGSRGSC